MGAILQIPQEVEFCLGHSTTLRNSCKKHQQNNRHTIITLSSNSSSRCPIRPRDTCDRTLTESVLQSQGFLDRKNFLPGNNHSMRTEICPPCEKLWGVLKWLGAWDLKSLKATMSQLHKFLVGRAKAVTKSSMNSRSQERPFQSSSHLSQASMVFCGNSCKYLIAGHLSFSVSSFSCAIKKPINKTLYWS